MEGYSQVADFMSHASEMAMFRRFGRLNVENLLYLQAELVQLEKELADLAKPGQQPCHPNAPKYRSNWSYLRHSERDGNGEQWQKILEIRSKLKEYNNCLEQYALLLRLGGPSKYDLGVFQCWLQSGFPLTGEDKNVWDGPSAIEDLVALCRRDVDDIFSKFFLHRLIPVFHWTLGKYLKKHPSSTLGLSEYDDERLLAILQIIITVISSIFPISSIVILYFVNSMPTRLGIVAGYTALFSIALALLTRARRVEIFAATAAFAAVQVVFISTNGTGWTNQGQ